MAKNKEEKLGAGFSNPTIPSVNTMDDEITFGSDRDSGLFRTGANSFSIKAGGTTIAAVTSSGIALTGAEVGDVSADSIETTPVKAVTTYGDNAETDSDLTEWVITPQNCVALAYNIAADKQDNRYAPTRSTDKYAGTYALKFNGATGYSSLLRRTISGLSAGNTLDVKLMAKTTGTGSAFIIMEYNDAEETTYFWNWTTHAWVEMVVSADTIYPLSLTTSYASYDTESVTNKPTVPADITSVTIIIGSLSDDVYVDNAEYRVNAGEYTSISDFETWVLYDSDTGAGSYNILYNWQDITFLPGTGEDYSAIIEQEDLGGGAYAAKLTSTLSGENNKLLILNSGRGVTGVAGTYYTFYADMKSTAGTGTPVFVFFNDYFRSATQVYNFTTAAWENYTGDLATLDSDNIKAQTTTTEFVEKSVAVVVPVSGKIFIAVSSSASDQDPVFVKDLEAKPTVFPDAESLFEFTNASDAANLDANDTVFEFKTTGGTDKSFLKMDGTGVISTELDDINLSGEYVRVKASGAKVDYALNYTSGYSLLGVSDSVNLKNTGSTTMNFTLPSGYKIMNPTFLIEVTAADTLSGDATFTIGTNSDTFDNILGSTTQTLTSTLQLGLPSTGGPFFICSTAGAVYVKLTGADSGTSGTAKFYLFGTLIAT